MWFLTICIFTFQLLNTIVTANWITLSKDIIDEIKDAGHQVHEVDSGYKEAEAEVQRAMNLAVQIQKKVSVANDRLYKMKQLREDALAKIEKIKRVGLGGLLQDTSTELPLRHQNDLFAELFNNNQRQRNQPEVHGPRQKNTYEFDPSGGITLKLDADINL